MKKITIFLCCILFTTALHAQYQVSGQIVFAGENKPVAGASVFLTGTSIGTVSGSEGNFRLSNVPAGNYDLIVSYVGYETVQRTVTITNANAGNILIAIKAKPKELEAVIVNSGEKQTWEKWGRFFTEQFIGSGSWAADCSLDNYQQIQFRFNKKTNFLIAFCDADLLIINKKLGYRIKYKLERFEYDFKEQLLYYEGYPLFEEMSSKRAAQKKRWAAARQEAFYGSQLHFMRCLYRNKLETEGFELRRLVKTRNYEKQRVQRLYRESARQNLAAGILQPPTFPQDSAALYEKILRQNDWIDRYSPYTITGDSIAYAYDSTTAVLEFENHLYIVYKNALEDEYYAKNFSGSNGRKNPSSAIRLVNNKEVLVFANGAFYKTQDILSNGYWAWSEKICRMLPYDYEPVERGR
jgi:CarboxypepD_reg-like domain